MEPSDTDIFNVSLSQAAKTVEDALQSPRNESVASNVGSSRKRHLSDNSREILKPKRKATMTLATATEKDSGKNVKKPRGGKGKNKTAGEEPLTPLEQSDSDIANLDTRQLVVKMYSEMHIKLNAIGTRMDMLEDNLEKKLSEKLAKIIDKRVNTESSKLKKEITESVNNVRSDFDKEINHLTRKVDELEKLRDNLSSVKDDRKLNLVVRMLPYTVNENLERKLYSLFRDGLKLNGVKILSAERKLSYNRNPGVVIVKFENEEERQTVLDAKAQLKSDKQYEQVYIVKDKTREERLMAANFRTLVGAYKSGQNDIQVKGTCIIPGTNDARGNIIDEQSRGMENRSTGSHGGSSRRNFSPIRRHGGYSDRRDSYSDRRGGYSDRRGGYSDSSAQNSSSDRSLAEENRDGWSTQHRRPRGRRD